MCKGARVIFPLFTLLYDRQGWAMSRCSQGSSPATVNRVDSAVLPRWGPGPTYLNVADGKGVGQLPHQLEAAGTKGRAFFTSPLLPHCRQGRRYLIVPFLNSILFLWLLLGMWRILFLTCVTFSCCKILCVWSSMLDFLSHSLTSYHHVRFLVHCHGFINILVPVTSYLTLAQCSFWSLLSYICLWTSFKGPSAILPLN